MTSPKHKGEYPLGQTPGRRSKELRHRAGSRSRELTRTMFRSTPGAAPGRRTDTPEPKKNKNIRGLTP